jgi:hypothetical protein
MIHSDNQKKGKPIRSVVLLLAALAVVVTVLIGTMTFGGAPDDQPIEPPDKEHYVIFPPLIPDELTFSGEDVPVHLFDVREALDRELLSNMYFHSQTIRLIKLSHRYFPRVVPVLDSMGIPEDFKYLMVAESNLSNAVSPAGAVGFWQLVRGTAEEYGLEVNSEVDERYHLEKSTMAAGRYLLESFEKYGNWTLAAASYNAGRRGMDRQIDRQKIDNYYDLLLNEETGRYVFRVLALKLIMENPDAYGFHISLDDVYKPVPYHTVTVDGRVSDFADFAFEHHTNYKMLKFLNPWLRDNQLSNIGGKTYEIRIVDEGFRENVGTPDN